LTEVLFPVASFSSWATIISLSYHNLENQIGSLLSTKVTKKKET
jgi:hypothetical protein